MFAWAMVVSSLILISLIIIQLLVVVVVIIVVAVIIGHRVIVLWRSNAIMLEERERGGRIKKSGVSSQTFVTAYKEGDLVVRLFLFDF